MSTDSKRKQMRETLARYTLMNAGDLASFLGVSEEHARDLLKEGKIPWVNTGLGSRPEYRVDPLDAAVFVLAQRDGVTPDEYWKVHGEATAEHARRYVTRIRKLVA